ncbi:hypothetical protein L3X38_001487 [Prunus dulcis]|uniref:Uncharacterized protein n=1 Tax=Prunus dulcis TaxID=3755 RepID=A0AAD4WS61_PRUDU|nr:hypothetical protein L3X38_001487 [Prunus dulcis]
MLLANRRPAKRASYSASLLEVQKSNRRPYSILSPSGVLSTKPAPHPCWFAEPSTCKPHTGVEVSKRSASSSTGNTVSVTASGVDCAVDGVSSEIKSATAWPFSAGLGTNCMSNSPSSITHLINRLEISGFWSPCRSGWLVRTLIP